MSKKIRYIVVFVLLILLVLIRLFENELFDDHLLGFFQYSYLEEGLPEVSFLEVYKVISLRFFFNAILSILILLLLFPQKNLLKFLLIFYGFGFVLLSFLFHYEWHHYVPGEYLFLFYVRRLLIQPIFLFILIPALVFHQMEKEA